MKAVVVIAFYVWLALTVAIVLGRLARWTASRQATRRRRKARLAAQAAEVRGPVDYAPAVQTPPIASEPVIVPRPIAVPEPTVEAEPQVEETEAEAEERRAAERRTGDRRVGDRRANERRTIEPETVQPETVQPETVQPETVEPTPDPARLTIARLLAGIAIPVDLKPIVADGAAPSDQFTSLICSERPAHDVGSGIADELERLGYLLTPVGDATLLASRVAPTTGTTEELTVEIDAAPASPDSNGRVRLPMAKPTDVVVDFWVGRGSRPY